MTKQLQKDAIDSAQALVNLCRDMKDCSECPFAYWNDSYDEGIAHCTIGCPADSWDIEKVSIKVKETEQEEKPKKIVPFDLSLKEDRDAVIGKRICSEDCDTIVCGCSKYSEDRWEFELSASICPVDARYVMRDFVFADGPNKGKPVGKEVET